MVQTIIPPQLRIIHTLTSRHGCTQAEKGAKKGEKAAPTFVTEAVPTESFFNFFDPPKVPGPADAEDMEMEELDEVQDALSNDFEVSLLRYPGTIRSLGGKRELGRSTLFTGLS